MSSINPDRKGNYKILLNSAVDSWSDRTVTSTAGIYFFKNIIKHSKENTFEKIVNINEIKDKVIDNEQIKKEKEFYYSKINNLREKLIENGDNAHKSITSQRQSEIIIELQYWI